MINVDFSSSSNKTFEMNESGFELFASVCFHIFHQEGSWGIKYNLSRWKNSFIFYNYSESDLRFANFNIDGPFNRYDTYYTYHENFIQSSWAGLGLTYRSSKSILSEYQQ